MAWTPAEPLKPGDKVLVRDAPLSRKERFWLWLRKPWRVPPKKADAVYRVAETAEK